MIGLLILGIWLAVFVIIAPRTCADKLDNRSTYDGTAEMVIAGLLIALFWPITLPFFAFHDYIVANRDS